MKKTITLLTAGLLLSSCLKLDDLAFPADNTISDYLLDEYPSETDLVPGTEYDLPSYAITRFSVISKSNDDTTAVKIEAIYIGVIGDISIDTIIVYCHGQSKHMDYYWQRAKLLANCGGKNRFGVLMMDYRGYGLSEGTTTEAGLTADVNACMDWLQDLGADQSRVFVYGFSLGSAPAVEVAAFRTDFRPAGLILESPFASADNMAEESNLINVDANFVMSLSLNNADDIKQVNQPLLWLHGTLDDYIPIANGELVYKNHSGSYKEAHRIAGANHDNGGVPQTMGLENYLSTIEKFLTR